MKYETNISGVISALPTAFSGKKIDLESIKKMVEFQLKNGINGFVVNGTTAESPTLTFEEVRQIYSLVREISGERVPIILGTGSNCTESTINNTKQAEDLGADAALVVVPYYNKPPQRGLVKHFAAVAEGSKLPIILYNVPGRTITSLSLESILELTKKKNIIAIKEASGDIAFDEKLKKECPPSFTLLSGDDPTYIDFLNLGGNGIISVMSNAITDACVRWTQMAQNKNISEAKNDFEKYKKLISLMYIEANPIPVKWMLYKMGLFKSPEMRLPLVELDKTHYGVITDELKKLGVIN